MYRFLFICLRELSKILTVQNLQRNYRFYTRDINIHSSLVPLAIPKYEDCTVSFVKRSRVFYEQFV